jgi:hypothetical protein
VSYHGLGATQAEVVAENDRRRAIYEQQLAAWKTARSNAEKACGMSAAGIQGANAGAEAGYQAALVDYEQRLKEYNQALDAVARNVETAKAYGKQYGFTPPSSGCITLAEQQAFAATCARGTSALRGTPARRRGGLGILGALVVPKGTLTTVKTSVPLVVKAADRVTPQTSSMALRLAMEAKTKPAACGQRLLPLCAITVPPRPVPPTRPVAQAVPACVLPAEPPAPSYLPVPASTPVPQAPPKVTTPSKPSAPPATSPPIVVTPLPPAQAPAPYVPPKPSAPPPAAAKPPAPVVVQTPSGPVLVTPEPAPPPDNQKALVVGGVLLAIVAGGVAYYAIRRKAS